MIKTIIIIASSLSFISLIITLIGIPLVLVSIPEDYFILPKGEYKNRFKHPAIRVLFHFVKNLGGAFLFISGVVMLFIPGQGIITMFIGVILLDFPGKLKLEGYIISRPGVLKFINKLRGKRGKAPLKIP